MYKLLASIFRAIVGLAGLFYAWLILATGFILFPPVVSLCESAITASQLEPSSISPWLGKLILGFIPVATLLTFSGIAVFIGYKSIRYLTLSKKEVNVENVT